MKLKRLVSAIVAVGMMVAMLPVSAVTAFAADGDTASPVLPALEADEFDADGLRYKILNDTDVSVIGPVEVREERVIPDTVTNGQKTYTVTEIADNAFSCYSSGSTLPINPLNAFVGRPNFTSVTIPRTVTRIGDNAFYGCIEWYDFWDDYSNGNPVERGLLTVEIESGSQLKTIGESAFAGCYSLKEFKVPSSVESIGKNAFFDCACMDKLTFEEGSMLQSIGDCAFHWAANLTSVTLPEGLKSIGYQAFYNCSNLESLTIPGSVTSIGESAFDVEATKESKLQNVNYTGTKEQWDALMENISSNTVLKNTDLDVKYDCFVKFVDNEHNTTTSSQTVKKGDKVAIPTAPKATGYKFIGWYDNEKCTGESFDFSTPIEANTTLYTKWEAIPDHELTVKVGTFTYDDNTASDKGNVYEGALVTVTFDENNQLWKDSGLSFDHWDIQSKAKLLDENGEEIVNPGKTFTFVMPKEGVTIEAMPKDATIEEEEEPNVLGTAAVIGTAAVGTAVLAYQTYQLGTEFYLICALPAGASIPTNRGELAELVWNDAGKPEPTAVLNADAAETDKAFAWAVENDLLKATKDNGEAYEATDPVSRIEVIKVWNQAQELK